MLPLVAMAAGSLTLVTDNLSSYASSTPALHYFSFKLQNSLPVDGKIRVIFPAAGGYDFSSVVAAMSGNPTVLDGGFHAPVVSGDSIVCSRDGTGTSVPGSSTILMWLALIGNPSSRRLDQSVVVHTLNSSNTIIDAGTSGKFHIEGPIASFSLTDTDPHVKTAGVPFELLVTNAMDVYGHPAADVVTVTAISGANPAPDGTLAVLKNISVKNGSGSAPQILFKKETGVILNGQINGISRTITFPVWHNSAITRLLLSGEPTTVQSESAFANPIKVTVFDPYGNLADTYNRTITFGTTDPSALKLLPTPYRFETDTTDNGQHSFPGSSFKLATVGAQRIFIYDDQTTPLRDTTDVITVTAGNATSFSLAINSGNPITAGVDFPIAITNAKDNAGNLVSGTATVSFLDAPANHKAPNGLTPLLAAIPVVNGVGTANSKLYLRESALQLRIALGSTSQTPTVQVKSGNPASLQLSGEPTSVAAGAAFANPILVKIYDAYANLVNTFTDTVRFGLTVADPGASLPPTYTFVGGDGGQHSFPGSAFKLAKAGTQRIWARNVALSLADTTNPITVSSGTLANFTLQVNSGNAVTAGAEFPVTISAAQDASGNPLTGTAVLSFDDGAAHTSPSGLAPQLTTVQVVNGSGSANSKLYKSGSSENNLKLRATMAGTEKIATIPSVLPGSAADLQLSAEPSWPSSLVAGSTLAPAGVRVKVVDAFGNLKNNFDGSVYFTSTDGQAVLPYTSSNKLALPSGDSLFTGTRFQFKSAGEQTLTVHSGTFSKTSAPILLQSTTIATFVLDVGSTQIAGQQFNLSVSSARDQYNNAASGTILVSAASGAGNAPNNNATPTLTNIAVTNGQGSSAQVLVRCEATTLRGVVQGNTSVTRTTTSITVNPGTLSYFDLSGTPTVIAAGAYFPSGVTVKAYDAFGNLKTNYLGRIYFTSSDASAELKYSSINYYTFLAGETGVHTFTGGTDFKLRTAGTQTLIVRDVDNASAQGQKTIEVSSITIKRIYSSNVKVSRGQQNAVVMMEVQNSATQALANLQGSLQFAVGSVSYTDDYVVSRTDGLTTIPASSQATLQFQVQVAEDAMLGTITVDGFVTGQLGSYTMADNDGADSKHSWQVQSRANAQIQAVRVLADTVRQGQSAVTVECDLLNNGTATANLTASSLEFLLENTSNVSTSFSVVPYSDNVLSLAGGSSTKLRYYISSSASAQLGRIYVYANLTYSDANSSQTYSVRNGLDTFISRESSVLLITEITPSRSTVTQGQTAPWTVYVGIKNSGSSMVTLSFNAVKTFIRIRKAQTDLTPTFTVVQPTTFTDGTLSLSGGETKRIPFVITKTGTELGVCTIFARAEATDGVFVSDASGSVEVQSSELVRVNQILASQPSVTMNDNSYEWKVYVLLENAGGSEVTISFDSLRTDLIQTPKICKLERPTALRRYGATLKSGQSDTLIYNVKSVGNAESGALLLDAKIGYRVINTSEDKTVTSAVAVRGSVQLQTASNFVIDRVRVSRKPVTQGRTNWWVTVQVSNQAGGSDVQINLSDSSKTWVKLYDSGGQPIDYYFKLPGGLAGSGTRVLTAGKKDSLIFQVKSAGVRTGLMSVVSQVTAVETNRAKSITALATGVLGDNVSIQSKAQILFVAKSLQPAYVSPGDVVRYQISASNVGGSTITLDPVGTKIEFSDGLNNYSARLDPALGIVLPGQSNTTLYFNLNPIATGFVAGAYFPMISLKGDENGNSFENRTLLSNNSTNVGTAKTLTIQSLSSNAATVTAGQTKIWKISMVLANNGDNTLRLDNSQLNFYSNEIDISNKFGVTKPALFNNGSLYLRGKSVQTLNFAVNGVSSTTPAGVVMIYGKVSLIDSARSSQTYSDETKQGNSAYVSVQAPAVLEMTRIRVSQPTITRGQRSLWQIGVGLKNSGGSSLEVRPSSGVSGIKFSKGESYFIVQPPTSFLSGEGLQLAAGAEDSLLYTVREVSPSVSVLGSCRISAGMEAIELNSDRILFGQNSPEVTIIIQDSAKVRIDTLTVDLPSDSTVNARQRFYFRAKVTNVGNGETVRTAELQLFSKEILSSFPGPGGALARVDTLLAGQSKWTTPGFLVEAANLELGSVAEHFHCRINQALSANTGGQVPVVPARQHADSSKTIQIQSLGSLTVDQVITSADTVPAGSALPWWIKVVVRNNGQGSLNLMPPASGDILFSLLGFTVNAPTLGSDELLLRGGEQDTLLYQVVTTGPSSGVATVTVVLFAKDVNDAKREPVQAMAQRSIQIASTSRVRITKTFMVAETNRVDELGVVHVNTGQNFRIGVEVKNEGGQNLRDIKVGLHASASTLINGGERLLNNLGIGEPSLVYFDVRADSVENLTGETFLAMINEAVGIDGSPARILAASDSTAQATIYRPALLQIVDTRNLTPNQTLNVSYGESFQIKVTVKNLGSEPVRNVLVRMDPDSLGKVTFLEETIAVAGFIAANDTGTAIFTVTALPRPGRVSFISTIVQSIGLNSNQSGQIKHDGENNTSQVFLEQGAQLKVLRVFCSVDEINAGDSNSNWRINVELVNNGHSALELTDVNRSNIVIRTEGVIDPNYIITPVSLVRSGGFQLPGGGLPDTLYYVVTKNGELAGNAEITVRVQGYDVNLGQPSPATIQTDSGKDTISVNSVSWVRIDLATVKDKLNDGRGNWLVNRGRVFQANVSVETGELGGVDSVRVGLTSNGLSSISPAVVTIPRLNRTSKDTARFTITADASWSQQLMEKAELFSAKILSAKTLGTRLNAQIRSPRRDSDAQIAVRIQNPARVKLDLYLQADKDTILTAGQVFTLTARMSNLGSAPVNGGRIRLELPEYFSLANKDSSERNFYINSETRVTEDSFRVVAPNFESLRDVLRCSIILTPQDLNNRESALLVADGRDSVWISTSRSGLILAKTRIYSPNGALAGEISTLQYFGVQTEIQATPNLKNVKVTLEMPKGLGYQPNLETPLEREITSVPTLLQWTLRAPDKPIADAHVFYIRAQGQSDLSVKSVLDSVQISRVVRRAQLSLQPLAVSSPLEAIQSPGGVFSAGQSATLSTMVTNSGTAKVSQGKIKIDFLESGFTLASGETAEKTFTISNIITWNVIAPLTPSVETKQIEIRITAIPIDEHTGQEADIIGFPNNTLSVLTIEAGSISTGVPSITAPTGAVDKLISTDQGFEVTVEVTTRRVVRDKITAQLVFNNKEFKIDQETKNVTYGENQKVQWNVTAPAVAKTTADSFYVIVKGYDERSPSTTRSLSSPRAKVTVQSKTIFTMRPWITLPDSLNQYVVSTEEDFVLSARLRAQGAPYALTDPFVVQMTKPVEFTTTDSLELSRVNAHPYWRLRAPSKKPEGLSIFRFRLKKVPRDLNSNQSATIENAEESYSIQVVRRAEIAVVATLSDTAQVTYAPVRVGSTFNLRAYLYNLGEAGFIGAPVMSFALPKDYTLIKKSGVDTITWQLRAPITPSDTPDTMVVKLLKPLPVDQFSHKTVLVSKDSAIVIVKREAGMLVIKQEKVKSGTTMIKGTKELAMLGFSLRNKDISLNSRSVLDTLRLSFKDKKGNAVKAKDIITRIVAVKSTDNKVLAELTQPPAASQVTLDFHALHADTIKDHETFSIKLLVDVLENPAVADFEMRIDSAGAVIAKDAFSRNRLLLADSTEKRVTTLAFSSGAVVLIDQQLEESFCNYPNPFGTSVRPLTHFVYYLPQASDLSLKIFTLTGDLVFRWDLNKAEHPTQTSAGLHDGHIYWDGRNGLGRPVMSGVYLAYLSVDGGQVAISKIAVIR